MTDEGPIKSLWQMQPVDPKQFDPEELREKAARFQRKVLFRNVREQVAAVIVLVVFTHYAVTATTWLAKTGHALVVLGTLYIMFHLHTRGASAPVPGGERCLDFHRRELERQRDLLRSVWRWYLGPLIPGLAVTFVDRFLAASAQGSTAMFASLGSAGVSALVFVGVGWLNAAGARKLQRDIDALAQQTS